MKAKTGFDSEANPTSYVIFLFFFFFFFGGRFPFFFSLSVDYLVWFTYQLEISSTKIVTFSTFCGYMEKKKRLAVQFRMCLGTVFTGERKTDLIMF